MTLETRFALADRVRELRLRNNLTQSKLALMVGLNRSYISRIEHARCNPGLANLEKIAAGFDLTLAELLEGIDAHRKS